MAAAAQTQHPGQVISARMAGFIGHLRLNGFPLGPRETEGALEIVAHGANLDPDISRLRLKTALCGRHEDWERFDDLFEAFWFARGRERVRERRSRSGKQEDSTRPKVWDSILPPDDSTGVPRSAARGDGEGDSEAANGRLVASRQAALSRTDLRRIVDANDGYRTLSRCRRVGVLQGNDVALLQPGHIEIEARLCARDSGDALLRARRQGEREPMGELIQLRLRFHERLVTELDERPYASGRQCAVANQINRKPGIVQYRNRPDTTQLGIQIV